MNISKETFFNRKTILLMSSGRSGSTWLAGLLASPFRYRLLFEPFHPDHVPRAELIADRYYSPESLTDEVIDFFKSALNDHIHNKWVAQSSSRLLGMHNWRWWPKVRIVKCIRGNLIVPVLHNLYGNTLPIVVLVRHPGAVVQSMLRVNFPWAFDLSTLLAQKEFAHEYNIPFGLLKEQAKDPVSNITVRWLIENLYLFQNATSLGIKLVFYEDLIQDPIFKINQLCSELGIKVYKNLPKIVGYPSYTTHPRSQVRNGTISPHSWRTQLPKEKIYKIESIINSVDFLYPYN